MDAVDKLWTSLPTATTPNPNNTQSLCYVSTQRHARRLVLCSLCCASWTMLTSMSSLRVSEPRSPANPGGMHEFPRCTSDIP